MSSRQNNLSSHSKSIRFNHGSSKMNGPIIKPKDRKGTLTRIWSYMKRQKAALILAILFVLISTILGLIGPFLIGVIIDQYILPKDIAGTIQMVTWLAIVYAFTSVFSWLQSFIMVRISQNTIQTMRQDIFDHLQSLSLRFFDRRKYGELMSRVTNDMESLNSALSQSVIQIISTILTVIGVTIIMLKLNWLLALVSFIVIPLMFLATNKIIQYSSSNFIKRQRDIGEMNGIVEESISGMEVITLFGQEKVVYDKFSMANERWRQSAMMADISSGFLGPMNNFINNLGLCLIIGVGSLLAINELTTIGVIASFVTYSRQFYRPINQLSNLMNTFQSAIAGAERVFEITDEVPDLINRKNAVQATSFNGDIEFSNVSFCYKKGQHTLKEIDFKVKAGQTIAFVGPTGSGKTTLMSLLARFYDVDTGEIRIDSRNIKEYTLCSLRSKIGMVLQDTYLFSGTIMENIRYGRLDATGDEVIEAAKAASAHRFIKHLPKRYLTLLDSGGTNLSQGQRQLIAIARAVLANSDILILDEATSSIDTRTELEIQKGLSRLTSGKTSFIIAHRLKTIENADQIIVIKDGRIVEKGTHSELLSYYGFYYEMYSNQFGL